MLVACRKPNNENELWYEVLPDCPCNNPDMFGILLDDGWAKDSSSTLSIYHPGAYISFRSYPRIKTTEGLSGQQCCYDSTGTLITEGPAAGTPDKISTCIGENTEGEIKKNPFARWQHSKKDVEPWRELGWELYNQQWPPNQGTDCQ